MTLRRLLPALLALVALVAFAPAASAAGHAKRATVRSFSGTVAKVTPRSQRLALRTGVRRVVKLRVSRSTRGVRLGRLRSGQRVVVRAVRTRRGWSATRITVSKVSATDESGDDDPVDADDESADGEDVSGDDEAVDEGGDTAFDGEDSSEETPAGDDF